MVACAPGAARRASGGRKAFHLPGEHLHHASHRRHCTPARGGASAAAIVPPPRVSDSVFCCRETNRDSPSLGLLKHIQHLIPFCCSVHTTELSFLFLFFPNFFCYESMPPVVPMFVTYTVLCCHGGVKKPGVSQSRLITTLSPSRNIAVVQTTAYITLQQTFGSHNRKTTSITVDTPPPGQLGIPTAIFILVQWYRLCQLDRDHFQFHNSISQRLPPSGIYHLILLCGAYLPSSFCGRPFAPVKHHPPQRHDDEHCQHQQGSTEKENNFHWRSTFSLLL